MECTIMSSLRYGNNLLKGKKGQVRIIESLLACILLLSGLSVIVQFGGVQKTSKASDLEEVGENILSILDDTDVITKIAFTEADVDAEIKALIEAMLPPDVYYVLSISGTDPNHLLTEISNVENQSLLSNLDAVSIQEIKPISLPVARKALLELDVVLIIDRSGSMGWESPTRISYAKAAAKTFIDQLNTTRDLVGLTSFATSGSINHHLSNNFPSVKSAINSLTANGYTNMGEGIEKTNNEFEANQRTDTIKAAILLSDGFANIDEGGYPPAYDEHDDRTPVFEYVQDEADVAGDNGVVLYTIGLGNSTDQFDEDLLKQIVKNGGSYYRAPSAEDLEDIYNMIAVDLLYRVQYDVVRIEITLIRAG
jgi:Mg-chelatase subunit ChlD